MLLKSFYMLPHWHKIQNWKYVSYIKISIPNWMVLYTYIHLIKCFPLKSYIWPHIGLGRSWKSFLFLSKFTMSPVHLTREAPFSSSQLRKRWHSDPAPPHHLGEIGDLLNINITKPLMNLRNITVSVQKGHMQGPWAHLCHLPGPVSWMWILEGALCLNSSEVSCLLHMPAVLKLGMLQACFSTDSQSTS